ncbi:MAG: 3-hydroxyacyl-CoA dehydrogenase family protein, partial [Pirellulaceae bacterium]
PVSDIAEAVTHPERLVGLHFCCPVEPMRLVEIIASSETADLTTNVAIDFVRRMRKTPVVVGDHPGFVVNRMLAPFFNHTLELLQHDVDPRRIDKVMREFGFAVGPLEMIDFIGVDTIMYAGETFLRTLPDLIILNPILPALVKRNRNGRKVNLGFYRYASFDAPPEFDPELTTILDKYQRDPITISDEEIQERLLGPMAVESQKILDDEEVHDARDIDLCSILGTTFPKTKGGVLFWANELRPVRAD